MEIQKPRGTLDFEGLAQQKKSFISYTFDTLCRDLGFTQITTPLFERKDLYVRSVGDDSDIVEKELFELENKSENSYVLRPELTAGIVRSLAEGGARGRQLPIFYYSIGEIFRYDKPQKSRYRQSSQLDMEIFGASDPITDVFLINTISLFFRRLNVNKKIIFNINTLGSTETKIAYSKKLVIYLEKNTDYLCADCQRRMTKNPLRVLDCKQEQCKKIASSSPSIYDSLTDQEKADFKKIVEGLETLKIPFNIDQTLVRGLDYYTGLIFEVNSEDDKERKLSIGGGGRYDRLVSELSGNDLAACGYGLGIERIIDLLEFDVDEKRAERKKIIIIPTSEKQKVNCIKIQNKLIEKDNSLVFSYLKKSSLSDALSYASKYGYDLAVIAGDEEEKQGKFILKDLKKNSQVTMSEEEVSNIV